MILKCKCASCQKEISRQESKSLMTADFISCPHCQASLSLNRQTRSIAYILLAALFVALIYALRNWVSPALFPFVAIMSALSFVLLAFILGEPIAKRLCLGLSLILPFRLAKKASDEPESNFLNLAARGVNNSWRYLLFLFIIFSGITQLLALPLLTLEPVLNRSQDPLINAFYGLMTAPVSGFVTMVIAIGVLHKRSFRSLITGAERISWQRIFQGAGIYFAIGLVLSAAGILLNPDEFTYTFEADRWLRFLPFVLILTPIQALSEELLFRGYIMQGLGLVMDKSGAAILSALIFALPHLAMPIAQSTPLLALATFFMVGIFLALITLKDNTSELAIGVHMTQNICSFLLIGPHEGLFGIPMPVLYTSKSDAFSVEALVSQSLYMLLFWIIAFKCSPFFATKKGLLKTAG